MATGRHTGAGQPPHRDIVKLLDDVYTRILVPSLDVLNASRERVPRQELEDIVYDFLDLQWRFIAGEL
jgi:hypothetical protein